MSLLYVIPIPGEDPEDRQDRACRIRDTHVVSIPMPDANGPSRFPSLLIYHGISGDYIEWSSVAAVPPVNQAPGAPRRVEAHLYSVEDDLASLLSVSDHTVGAMPVLSTSFVDPLTGELNLYEAALTWAFRHGLSQLPIPSGEKFQDRIRKFIKGLFWVS